MVNMLSFTQLKSGFLESLKGKNTNDSAFSKVWSFILERDPCSSPIMGDDHSSSTLKSSLSSDALNRWKHFSIDQGYLMHKGRMCVPSDLDIRRQILFECHDSPSAGHPRIRKTYALVRR